MPPHDRSPFADPDAQRSSVREESIRWWRIAFIGYAFALHVPVFWPRLELGEPGLPSPDKILHLYMFGALAGAAYLTRWTRSITLIAGVLLVWVVAVEYIQATGLVGRQVSWQDAAAGGLGVIAACAIAWSFRSGAGDATTSRRALRERVLEVLFSSPLRTRRAFASWSLLVLAFVPVGLSILLAWPHVVAALPNPLPGILYGTAQALWLGLLIHLFGRLWTSEMQRARTAQWCPQCAQPCATVEPSADGNVRCPHCGSDVHVGVWLEDVTPQSEAMRRISIRPALVGVGFLAFEFFAIYGFVAAYRAIVDKRIDAVWVQRIARELNHMPREFTMAVDFGLLLIGIAIMIRLYRGQFARLYDEQARTCRRCAHDLRYTPVSQGIGVCGECGAPFARFSGETTTPAQPE